jgi:hypothetical protein
LKGKKHVQSGRGLAHSVFLNRRHPSGLYHLLYHCTSDLFEKGEKGEGPFLSDGMRGCSWDDKELDFWLQIEYINIELIDLGMWNLGIPNFSYPQSLN